MLLLSILISLLQLLCTLHLQSSYDYILTCHISFSCLRSDRLGMSSLMPFSYMNSVEFREYTTSLSSNFQPYSCNRLIAVTATHVYVPSIMAVKSEMASHLSWYPRSVALNLEPFNYNGNESP